MIRDQLKIRGQVNLNVFDKEDKLIDTISFENLVVNLGRQAIATMLGTGDVTKRITHVCFGENGTPAALTDTTITNEVSKAVNGVSYAGTSVVYDISIELNECNGMMIREFGLRCFDGDLFARTVRAVIQKTPDIRIQGTWTITI